jgi:hypothetical protein
MLKSHTPYFISSETPLSCLIPEKGMGPRTLYAMDTKGALHHIDKIPTSTPDLVCPDCKGRLIAKHFQNSSKKKADHFAHYKTEECKTAGETALHLMGKSIFNQIQHFNLPSFKIEVDWMEDEYFCELDNKQVEISAIAKRMIWDKNKGWTETNIFETNEGTQLQFVIESVEIEFYDNGIRPDLILKNKQGKKLYVEICVTHKVDDKKEKILIQRKQPTIEIDLSGENRNSSFSELKEIIQLGDRSQWIYNEAIHQKKSALLEKQKQLIAQKKQKRQQETRATKEQAQKAVKLFQTNLGSYQILHPQNSKINILKKTLLNLDFDPVSELQLTSHGQNSNSPFTTDELIAFYAYFELTVFESLKNTNKILKSTRIQEVENKIRYIQSPVSFDFSKISKKLSKNRIIKTGLLQTKKEQEIFCKRIDPQYKTAIQIFEQWLKKMEDHKIVQTIQLSRHRVRKTLHTNIIKIRAQKYGVDI